MPPADNNTPAAPAPQEQKKGFFAKLFGLGKNKEKQTPVVPPTHESQTPPPQLDDTQDPASPGEGAMLGATSDAQPVESSVSTVEATPVVSTESSMPVPDSVEVSAEVSSGESTEDQKPPVGPVPPAQ